MGKRKETMSVLLLALPALVYLIINNYIPMFGIFIAFKNFDYSKGIFKSDWVGFKNFEFLFMTADAYIMIRNTILYNLAFIIFGTIVAVGIAILLAEIKETRTFKFIQAGMILPNLISMVVVSYIVYAFLSPEYGFINKTLGKIFGIQEMNWYQEPKYWPFILIIVFLWKNAGYLSVIYAAFIMSIDESLYEAAKIDGANKFQQICYITLPMLKQIVIVMVLLSVGRIFNSDFGLFYQVPMNSGALYDVTQTIDTYVYRALMQTYDVGMASAAGLFQSVVGFITVIVANAIVRKINPENALF